MGLTSFVDDADVLVINLRQAGVAGAETVILLGNSGGGSLMAAYQSQATQASLSALPGLTLPEAVNDLAPADAVHQPQRTSWASRSAHLVDGPIGHLFKSIPP